MERVWLVTQDQRLILQLKSWAEELPFDLVIESGPDLQFCMDARNAQIKINEQSAPAVTEAPPTTEDPVGSPQTSYWGRTGDDSPTLIVLDHPSDFGSSDGWVANLRVRLKEAGLLDPERPPLFLLLVPDDPRFPPETYARSQADDLIARPIDRVLFLQKLEILFSRGKPINPSYLYRMKTELKVEIAKDCEICELSEVDALVRNPRPLRAGLYFKLHSDAFGETEDGSVVARVTSCRADIDGQSWLVRLRFFGLREVQLNHVRRTMRGIENEMPRARLSKGLASVKREETPVRPLRVITIDADPTTGRSLRSALEENVNKFDLREFRTPTLFMSQMRRIALLKNPLPADAASPAEGSDNVVSLPVAALPEGASELWRKGERVEAVVRGNDGSIVRLVSPSKTFLGSDVAYWVEHPERFKAALSKDDQAIYGELLDMVSQGGVGEVQVTFATEDGRTQALVLHADRLKEAHDPDPALIRLIMSEATLPPPTDEECDIQSWLPDVLLVDAGFLLADPTGRVGKLRSEFVTAGLVAKIEDAREIYVLAKTGSYARAETFRIEGVSHFAWKLNDRRHLLESFLTFAPAEIWTDKAPHAARVICQKRSFLSRDSFMEELSEFGLSIRESIPFAEGALLRFFSPVLGLTRNGVLARCVCTRSSGENVWVSEFVFFGNSDEFQKSIRSYVLEAHARKRAAGEN
jgi:hypothetical protein